MSDFGLKAVLTADITSFEGAMLAATQVARKFASDFADLMKSVASQISEGMDRVAKSFKDSGNFDISVASMQKLQFAASQTGTSMTFLEAAMRRMTKNIGQATFGQPQANDTFRRLGLDAKELAALPLDQQMLKIGRAFEEVKNTTQAATLSMRLFGIAGTREMQFLKELGDNSAKFDKLLRPQTEREGGDIWQAKQGLLEINAILENTWNILASKFATPIRNIITMFEEWRDSGGFFKITLDDIYEAFQKVAFGAITAGVAIKDIFKSAAAEMQRHFNVIMGIVDVLKHPLDAGYREMLKEYATKEMTPFDMRKSATEAAELFQRVFKELPFTPRGRNGNQELMDEAVKSSPIGYALQITSLGSIGSMQLAAREVQEVHAPGVEKAIEKVQEAIENQHTNSGGVGVFGP